MYSCLFVCLFMSRSTVIHDCVKYHRDYHPIELRSLSEPADSVYICHRVLCLSPYSVYRVSIVLIP